MKDNFNGKHITIYTRINYITNMKVQILKLSQISENPTNTRTITPEALEGLQDSILAFPKMQEIRPIIVDRINTALGGNMRIRALSSGE